MIEANIHEESRRDDVENQRVSWAVSHLMSATGNFKKRIKPTDLYKPLDTVQEEEKKKVVKRFDSPEDKQKYLDDLKRKFRK